MTELQTNELIEIEGGNCVGAAGVATGAALAGPFTDGLGFAVAVIIWGGMFIAGCD
jgi:hypothetical protein